MCEKNNCGKKNQEQNESEYHSLTKQIYCLQLKKNKLFKKNIDKNQTYCSICFCCNPAYKITTDEGIVSNLCNYCVNKVKENKKPEKSPYEYECPVCGELDGILTIKKLTNNMCSSCFSKIIKL